MCLGIPGQIVEFVDDVNDIAKFRYLHGVPPGRIDFSHIWLPISRPAGTLTHAK